MSIFLSVTKSYINQINLNGMVEDINLSKKLVE